MRVLVVLLATVALAVLAACGADPANCGNGVAVRNPDQNPGLIQDCDTLLAIRDELAGVSRLLNWSADRQMSNWDGIFLGGRPGSGAQA